MKYILPTLLFALVAVTSFSMWALGASFFPSEPAMYTGCAIVFLGFGGLALTPGTMVSGSASRARFAGFFAMGFVLYSILWSVCWLLFPQSTILLDQCCHRIPLAHARLLSGRFCLYGIAREGADLTLAAIRSRNNGDHSPARLGSLLWSRTRVRTEPTPSTISPELSQTVETDLRP